MLGGPTPGNVVSRTRACVAGRLTPSPRAMVATRQRQPPVLKVLRMATRCRALSCTWYASGPSLPASLAKASCKRLVRPSADFV
jgi:hypothetical protein